MTKATIFQYEEIIKVPRFEEKAGFYTTQQRSRTMSKIKGKNTKPELIFRRALWKAGLRYRTYSIGLPGKPDIFITKYRLAIFIDGGFWHGYDFEVKKTKIKTNRSYWIPKIERNTQRDRQVNEALEEAGYTVMRFWDHEVKQNLPACINQVKLYVEAAREGLIPSK